MNTDPKRVDIYCEMIEHQITEARISQLQFRSTSYLISHASFGFNQYETVAINKAFGAKVDIKKTIRKFAEKHGLGIIHDESVKQQFIYHLIEQTSSSPEFSA
ncbi:hypothetical protein [Photobacterium lutimaris]|uniref:Uncharacterized protein n=1 Tax=Photobacterium lutimaris TaxID=388278 RepID=A0A2T3ITK0_9GAMM|nr:hypothetical protein [Photobacterium lutimaris]PSU31690.1 hypothetical protein C9I99_21115 [Photobacterium lutimaris]TDR72673.1 hypothetical protein DFP78_113149 [Photobacterium lutimaris]